MTATLTPVTLKLESRWVVFKKGAKAHWLNCGSSFIAPYAKCGARSRGSGVIDNHAARCLKCSELAKGNQ